MVVSNTKMKGNWGGGQEVVNHLVLNTTLLGECRENGRIYCDQ